METTSRECTELTNASTAPLLTYRWWNLVASSITQGVGLWRGLTLASFLLLSRLDFSPRKWLLYSVLRAWLERPFSSLVLQVSRAVCPTPPRPLADSPAVLPPFASPARPLPITTTLFLLHCSPKGGIGAETALLFARAGANLILTARRQAQLDEVATKARESGVTVSTHIVDMRDRSAIKAFAESA